MMSTIPKVNQETFSWRNSSFKKVRSKIHNLIKVLLFEKGWLLFLVAFLLGRAIILSIVSPFSIAFLATVWFVDRRRSLQVILATLLGALTLTVLHTVFVAIGFATFMLLANSVKKFKSQQTLIPVITFISTISAQLFIFSIESPLSAYEWILLFVEGILALVLVLIFMQSIPLLSPNRYKISLKNEEIICMIILIASILTGTIGWEISGAAMEQILSRYIVLVLAYVGGAAIGSTVGVVAGLILSLASATNLYQMSLLAFSGLLGGLLKDGKKLGVSLGLLVGTLLVGMYGDVTSLSSFFTESVLAMILFIFTPTSLFKKLSKYIPGTEEYAIEQEQYLQRIRNVTAERVDQFSNVFEALSKSFLTNENYDRLENELNKDVDYFLSNVTETTCQTCFMKERCWQKEFDTTYTLMTNLKNELKVQSDPSPSLFRTFENHCIKAKNVVHSMKEEMSSFHANQLLKKQVSESKRLVADQLQGVSKVMGDFAKEILKEKESHEKQEIQIIQALKQLGIELEKLNIFQLGKGNIDIEMTISFYEYRGEGAKLIAPVLSDILNELVIVKEEKISPFPNGYSYISFHSAKEFVIETGVANVARGGGFISGDSYTMLDLGTGKYAIAISDGMGNGKRAKEESEETLRLLRQILQTGIPERVAIQSINSILALRTTDEVYATLDLAVINLHNAFVRFLKVGSTPSFIKRGNQILKIKASNLPIGIIPDFDIDVVSEQLKPGDILVMMSDGIFEGPKYIENNDLWIKRKIRDMETNKPQEIADLLLEEVVRAQSGTIEDDMTVLVAKVVKNVPEWSTISLQKQEVQ